MFPYKANPVLSRKTQAINANWVKMLSAVRGNPVKNFIFMLWTHTFKLRICLIKMPPYGSFYPVDINSKAKQCILVTTFYGKFLLYFTSFDNCKHPAILAKSRIRKFLNNHFLKRTQESRIYQLFGDIWITRRVLDTNWRRLNLDCKLSIHLSVQYSYTRSSWIKASCLVKTKT